VWFPRTCSCLSPALQGGAFHFAAQVEPHRGHRVQRPSLSHRCRGNAVRAHGCAAAFRTPTLVSLQTRIVISRCCQSIRILERGAGCVHELGPGDHHRRGLFCASQFGVGRPTLPRIFSVVDDFEISGRRFVRARPSKWVACRFFRTFDQATASVCMTCG
jgi:hypothetical protein